MGIGPPQMGETLMTNMTAAYDQVADRWMSEAATRRVIRQSAESLDCKYRITNDGAVHFYGTMPNTNQVGWWLYARNVQEAVDFTRG